MSLAKIFSLYTICFLGVTILIGIAEQLFGLSPQWIGWIFMGLSLGIYIVIGIVTRTSNPDQYYVAGRGVPAVFNGMATGSDWMSAASFISMAGALSAQGFAGLAYVMGWTGGYLLLAVFLGPYLRQFGAYTIPDFLGARYGGNFARIIGVVAAIACSFTYLIAQVTGVGLIVSRFIGLDFNIGVFVGLIGVLFCSVLGGMKSVTWTQVAQYIILIVSYLVPVVYLSYQLFAIPIPELTYGRVLQTNNAKAIEITRDAREKETRALWAKEAEQANAKLKAGNVDEATAEKLKADGENCHPAGDRPRSQRRCHDRSLSDSANRRRHVEFSGVDLLSDGRHRRPAPYSHSLLHNAVGAPGADIGGLVAVLYFPALFHCAGLCGFRPVCHLRAPGRNADCRVAALGNALAARRSFRGHR